jgi:hypothetical protein
VSSEGRLSDWWAAASATIQYVEKLLPHQVIVFVLNRFHYTMLAWLPTYFTDTLSLNLTQAAQVQRVLRAAHRPGCRHKPSGWSPPGQARHTVHVCHRQVALAPPIAALLFSGIAGPAADALIDRGVDVERVRKISQCIAFLGPSALLTLASFTDSNWLAVGKHWHVCRPCICCAMYVSSHLPAVASVRLSHCPRCERVTTQDVNGLCSAALITGCLGLASFSLAGL